MRDLRFWRWRRAEDDDIDREVALHLELSAEERIEAGVPDRDARLEAHRQFGSIALTKEDLRNVRTSASVERLLSHAWRDFRHGVRLLRRSPGFTLAAVLILALPIAINTVVFSLVNTVLLEPRAGRTDALVAVFSRDRERPDAYRDFSYPLYVDLRDRSGVFDSLMAHTIGLVGIREGETTRRAFAEIISSNYFATLGVKLAAGRPFSLEEERPGANAAVVVASYAVWQRHGLDPGFVGSTVRVNGTAFTIVGVAPGGLRTTPLVSPDWWFPLGTYDRVINEWFRDGPKGLEDRGNHALFVAGALRPGLTTAGADRALEGLAASLDREFPATDRKRSFVVADVPLNLSSRPQSEAPVAFFASLLAVMAALVLAIACLNLANLMLARGSVRRREIGIRQALGGGRGRIVAQLLMEGLSLSLLGVVAGLILSWWAHTAFTAWLARAAGFMAIEGVDLAIKPSARMLLVACGLAVVSTLCFALGPAWRLSRFSVTSDLKEEPGLVIRRVGSGSILVGLQLTISLALLAVGGLFVRSATEAAAANPGFGLDRLLVASIDPSFANYDEPRTRDLYRRMLRGVQSLPGVEHASIASQVAFGEFAEGGYIEAPDRKAPDVTAGFTIITSEYFETLRLPILRGRGFSAEENERTAGSAAAVISETLARRLFPDGDPLGRSITLRRGSAETGGRGNAETREVLTIVGIVPGTTQDILDREPRSQVYVPYGARFRAAMTLHVGVLAQADEAATLTNVLRELRGLDNQLPVLTARTMTAQRDASIPRWAVRTAAVVFAMFGTLALLIAAIGVYGLEAYEVARRTREFGIRMALGATSGDIRRLVLQKGLKIAAVGLAAGLLLGVGIGRMVSSVLYRVSPLDPAALLSALLVLAAATLAACYVPARRATRIAAMEALRTE
ncbi:MAG TPA: ABC transporter permease [Vicinamibacterales bacterium]